MELSQIAARKRWTIEQAFMINEDDFLDPDDHQWDLADQIACEPLNLRKTDAEKIDPPSISIPNMDLVFNKGLTLDARITEAIEYYTRAME